MCEEASNPNCLSSKLFYFHSVVSQLFFTCNKQGMFCCQVKARKSSKSCGIEKGFGFNWKQLCLSINTWINVCSCFSPLMFTNCLCLHLQRAEAKLQLKLFPYLDFWIRATVQDSQLIFLFTLRTLICAEWNEPVGAEEVGGKSIKRVLKCVNLDAAESESENT